MKKLLLLALTTIMMVGCVEHTGTYICDEDNFEWKVVVVDSCEYLVDYAKDGNGISHKGNCKFCAERRKQELKELIEELKDK